MAQTHIPSLNATSFQHTKEIDNNASVVPTSHSDDGVGEIRSYDQMSFLQKLQTYSLHLDKKLHIESRGIDRCLPEDRNLKLNYVDMMLLWFSCSAVISTVATGLLAGPSWLGLSVTDGFLAVFFGTVLGAACAAFMGTFGPRTGLRQIILTRFSFGWYGSRLVALVNVITELGWCLVGVVVGGQILAYISNGSCPVVVGIIILSILSFVIAGFGYNIVHFYERYAFIPGFIATIILCAVGAKHYDPGAPSLYSGTTLAGNWLTMFTICFGSASGFLPIASDYYITYPDTTPRWKTFSLTWIGIVVPMVFFQSVGLAIGSALGTNEDWVDVYYDQGYGALIGTVLKPVHGFGTFLMVIFFLGLVGNNIPNTYSAGLSIQALSPRLAVIPRLIWTLLGVIIYTVCGVAGRGNLMTIISNFLSVIGYWTSALFIIVLEEDLIFRRKSGYDFDSYITPHKLPWGAAAVMSFLLGIVGAVLGMNQTWYVGVVARQIGSMGGELGVFFVFIFAGCSYPVLRYLERRFSGR
ncbi:hypothetical protein LTR10_022040 [Elasticomyces elasticus]|uniref:NCS1 nucleoside transporter n=1 Tax=Exophiala sideris TaxID=1016849 RepID=A0ABR0JLL6_9EURO|nr:hypothetical protein LTR10_022040 [Elasticomyces elasticus]KAK5036475.1 hypothetical protein LTS07_002202 [Exophiala sideris]KAK5041696.1 hypothetical protein LTR13_002363 [Exophiala sideris]KAK5066858.1 hypothetical protein LTR69_002206 [Exophiala sideris]KAK5184917.1 hypothetical protein LTR44_002763 [Eurotiomycetes sp. CCFEE 6388]